MENKNLYTHIVYTSKASPSMTEESLDAILKKARDSNKRNNLTGFLIVRDGYFLQLLEGPDVDVKNCFSKITKDSRHSNLVLQAVLSSNERMMGSWDMARVSLPDVISSSESLLSLFEAGRNGTVYKAKEPILFMLKNFSKHSKKLE
jgi:hypothetical protein